MADDLRLAQLLCSRLCHDLAGPAGAVANGLELLEDTAGDAATRALLAASSRRLGRGLALYRAAFGLSGGRPQMPLAKARALAVDYLDGSKLILDWPDDSAHEVVGADFGRLLLSVVLLAAGLLPRGGHIRLDVVASPAPGEVVCEATGGDVALPEALRQAMDPTVRVRAVTAPAAHAFYARRLAEALGIRLSVAMPAADRLCIRAGASADA